MREPIRAPVTHLPSPQVEFAHPTEAQGSGPRGRVCEGVQSTANHQLSHCALAGCQAERKRGARIIERATTIDRGSRPIDASVELRL